LISQNGHLTGHLINALPSKSSLFLPQEPVFLYLSSYKRWAFHIGSNQLRFIGHSSAEVILLL